MDSVSVLAHGLKALHADRHTLGGTVGRSRLDLAQIGFEQPLINVVRMGNGIADLGMLTADFAYFRHRFLPEMAILYSENPKNIFSVLSCQTSRTFGREASPPGEKTQCLLCLLN